MEVEEEPEEQLVAMEVTRVVQGAMAVQLRNAHQRLVFVEKLQHMDQVLHLYNFVMVVRRYLDPHLEQYTSFRQRMYIHQLNAMYHLQLQYFESPMETTEDLLQLD